MRAVTERMGDMTPQEQMEMANSMRPGAASVDPMGQDVVSRALGFPIPMLPQSVMADLVGSAMIRVYSPNAVSWIFGDLPTPTGDRPIFEHDGQGTGWKANAAADIWIVLKPKRVDDRIERIRVSDLQVGETYDAALPSNAQQYNCRTSFR